MKLPCVFVHCFASPGSKEITTSGVSYSQGSRMVTRALGLARILEYPVSGCAVYNHAGDLAATCRASCNDGQRSRSSLFYVG